MKRILLTLALLSCFISPAYPQEQAQDQLYVIDDFSGGLNTQVSDYGITKGECTVAENVRFNDEYKSIVKRGQILLYGTADASEPITGMHRQYLKDGTKVLLVSHGDEIEKGNDTSGAFSTIWTPSTAGYRWQFVTWKNIAIGTDGYNDMMKYDGTSGYATRVGSCFATDASSGGGPNGTYSYKVSFYTSSYECAFDVTSNTVIASNEDVTLSMIPLGPDTYLGESVAGRKVYRTASGGTVYYLLSNGTIADNATTTLTDTDADAALGATYSTSYTCRPPKGKFANIHKSRLFVANNPSNPSRIWYSDIKNPDYFQSTSYIDVRPDDGDEIMFMRNLLGILTVGKTNTIQKIYTEGDDPAEDWSVSDPFSFLGCQAPYTTVNTPYGILYLRNDGLYLFSGQVSSLVSGKITPTINDITESSLVNCWGEYRDNVYYMAYTSKSSGATYNNRVLVYDMLAKSFAIDKANVNAFCTFYSGTDWGTLYSGGSDSGKIYAHSSEPYSLIHSKHSDFDGTFEDCRYIPTGTPGGDADDPVIELAWSNTINEITVTMNSVTAASIIDRPDTDGWYRSGYLNVGASRFDKFYWNEDLNAAGDISFFIRAGATTAACSTSSWSSPLTDPLGTDISALSANTYIQYQASLTTTDIAKSPSIYKDNAYVVKMTYVREGATNETTIPIKWSSGWFDLGAPGYTKSLKKLFVFHEGSSGTLALTFTNREGDTDTFNIDLASYPNQYSEYFTNGQLNGERFTLDISNSDMNALKIKKIVIFYSIQPR